MCPEHCLSVQCSRNIWCVSGIHPQDFGVSRKCVMNVLKAFAGFSESISNVYGAFQSVLEVFEDFSGSIQNIQ